MSKEDKQEPILVNYATANSAMLSTLESKRLRKFARNGWNGKTVHVQVHGSIPTSQVELDNGEKAYIQPFFIIVNNKSGVVNTWVPSVSDLQATDWYEVLN